MGAAQSILNIHLAEIKTNVIVFASTEGKLRPFSLKYIIWLHFPFHTFGKNVEEISFFVCREEKKHKKEIRTAGM